MKTCPGVPLVPGHHGEVATSAPMFTDYRAESFLTDYSKLPTPPDADGAYRYRDPGRM